MLPFRSAKLYRNATCEPAAPKAGDGPTTQPGIGKAESHGSIRIANSDGIELARLIMEAAGEGRSSDWWDRVLGNEHEMVTVELEHTVPIRVREE